MDFLKEKSLPPVTHIETYDELLSYLKQLNPNHIFQHDKLSISLILFPTSLKIVCQMEDHKHTIVAADGEFHRYHDNNEATCEIVHEYKFYVEYELVQSVAIHMDQSYFLVSDNKDLIRTLGIQVCLLCQ